MSSFPVFIWELYVLFVYFLDLYVYFVELSTFALPLENEFYKRSLENFYILYGIFNHDSVMHCV